MIPSEDIKKISESKSFYNEKVKEIFKKISDDDLIGASAVSVLASIACTFIKIMSEAIKEDEKTVAEIFVSMIMYAIENQKDEVLH